MAVVWKKIAFDGDAPAAHEGSHVSGGSDDIDSALAPIAVALTTRGDIPFHDTSGLQRLAKSTEGFVLTQGANEPAWAAPAGGATKEFWVPVSYGNVLAKGDFAALGIGSNANSFHSFSIPADFTSITSAVIVGISLITNATSELDIWSDYGAHNQAYNTHSESDTASTYALNADQIEEIDISGILSSLAAGDYVGIKIRDIDPGNIFYVLGIKFKYS